MFTDLIKTARKILNLLTNSKNARNVHGLGHNEIKHQPCCCKMENPFLQNEISIASLFTTFKHLQKLYC